MAIKILKKYDVRNIWASCIFLPITKIWKTAQEPLICFLPAYDLGTVGYSSYKVIVYLKNTPGQPFTRVLIISHEWAKQAV